jgi:thiol-disulfide isomerase/thioredoxin
MGKFGRKIVFMVATVFFLFGIVFCFGEDKNKTSAPAFSGKDILGKKEITLKQYTNKVILLNFWATWCPPCRAEIPDLIELFKKYKKNFMVIGVSLDQEGPEVVKKFYLDHNMNYPVIMGTQNIVSSYGGISAIPTSFIINKKGEIVKKILGFRNKKQYEEEIKPYLSE